MSEATSNPGIHGHGNENSLWIAAKGNRKLEDYDGHTANILAAIKYSKDKTGTQPAMKYRCSACLTPTVGRN
jgi:hypothetical protein